MDNQVLIGCRAYNIILLVSDFIKIKKITVVIGDRMRGKNTVVCILA